MKYNLWDSSNSWSTTYDLVRNRANVLTKYSKSTENRPVTPASLFNELHFANFIRYGRAMVHSSGIPSIVVFI